MNVNDMAPTNILLWLSSLSPPRAMSDSQSTLGSFNFTLDDVIVLDESQDIADVDTDESDAASTPSSDLPPAPPNPLKSFRANIVVATYPGTLEGIRQLCEVCLRSVLR
jgi:hypothetical protein